MEKLTILSMLALVAAVYFASDVLGQAGLPGNTGTGIPGGSDPSKCNQTQADMPCPETPGNPMGKKFCEMMKENAKKGCSNMATDGKDMENAGKDFNKTATSGGIPANPIANSSTVPTGMPTTLPGAGS